MKPHLKTLTTGICFAFIIGGGIAMLAAPNAVPVCVLGAALFGILRGLLSVTKIL